MLPNLWFGGPQILLGPDTSLSSCATLAKLLLGTLHLAAAQEKVGLACCLNIIKP